MSHFTVAVLIPKDADVEAEVTRLLAPFDEGEDVPAYQTRCWCVGTLALSAATAVANHMHGTLEALRKSFAQAHPLLPGADPFADDEARDALWAAHIAPYRKAADEWLAGDPRKDAPRADCEECKATGLRETTYNPKSKWDWWVIGGRWAGTFTKNAEPVPDLLARWNEKLCPFAIVTPDGQWHERGRMGWFAMVADEKPRSEWSAKARSILADFPDHIAVGVDCHI